MRQFSALLILVALDLNSYCAGFCVSRYHGGEYFGHGLCKCFDLLQANPEQRFDIPRRLKTRDESVPPKVYYGTDQMSVPPADSPEPVPTW